MVEKDKKNDLLGDAISDLRGKQSVRTTFKLSEKSIEALSIMAYQLGIKQKSLFDHLIDDIKLLKQVAQSVEQKKRKPKCVPKTYVISRRTLENLDVISSRYSTPRDLLVEFSIKRLLPLIEEEKAKHGKRKELHERMSRLLQEATETLIESREYLDEDDPVLRKYESAVVNLENSCLEIEEYLHRASKVERF